MNQNETEKEKLYFYKCLHCKYLISSVSFEALAFDVGCPRCRGSLKDFYPYWPAGTKHNQSQDGARAAEERTTP